MIVEGFQLDLHDEPITSVDNLVPGLNLVIGPRGSGKSMVHQMLSQAVFGGRLHQRSPRDKVRLLISHDEGTACPDSSRPGAARQLGSLQPQQLPHLKQLYCLCFGDESESPMAGHECSINTYHLAETAGQRPCQYCQQYDHGHFDFLRHASVYLSQITEGHLVSFCPSPETGTWKIQTRANDTLCFHTLTHGGQDMLRISLSLALADRNRIRGINLPILLDEPFRCLDERETHLLVHLLHECSEKAQQIIVFTEQQISVDRCDLRGVAVHELAAPEVRCAKCNCVCHDTAAEASFATTGSIASAAEPWLCVFQPDDVQSDGFKTPRIDRSNQSMRQTTSVVHHGPDITDRPTKVEANDLSERLRRNKDDAEQLTSRASIRLASVEENCDEFKRRSTTGDSLSAGLSERQRSSGTNRIQHDGSTASAKSLQVSAGEDEKQLRFYLNPVSPVVDAPEIGPKMAERLQAVGINTIDDLLQADPEQIVEQMNHKRTNGDKVRRWQRQSRLMCRVPQLRGHDAQILVACDITDPEQLAAKNPPELFGVVGPFSETKEGIRIIRGGQQPDLNEVTDWITWAGSARMLDAA